MSAMADISFTEGGERLINTLHTHLYSPSSGLSSSDEIKLAAVCFINDTSACSGETFVVAKLLAILKTVVETAALAVRRIMI